MTISEQISVMVVDDDEFVRSILMESLTDGGFRVTAVKGGAEALSLLEGGNKPDVLVTDLVMPDIDGLEVIARVASEYPEIKMIALSGSGGHLAVDALKAAREAGADIAMDKPVEFDALEQAIEQLAGAI